MGAVRKGHGEGTGLQQVLGGLVVLVDEKYDAVCVADHAPGGVHHVDLSVFVVGGDHQHGHGIDSLYDAEILLHWIRPFLF